MLPNPEFEPKGEELVAKTKDILKLEGVPRGERLMIEHTLRLCEEEISKEGRVSEDGIINLSDFYEKYHPRTETETNIEIDRVVVAFKARFEKQDYLQDDIDAMSVVFKNVLIAVLTGDKLRNPEDILEKFFELYG